MTPEKIVEKTRNAIEASNRALIKELISDLEEKGIKPVIAIDGEVKKLRLIDEKKLRLIDDSQLQDFYQILDEEKLSRDDFALLEVDETAYKNDTLSYTQGKLIVVHKKSGKLKEYKVGHSSIWPADFAEDLKNNFFKS